MTTPQLHGELKEKADITDCMEDTFERVVRMSSTGIENSPEFCAMVDEGKVEWEDKSGNW